METTLVGVGFRPKEVRDIARLLREGAKLNLVRDIYNEYDRNAVKVLAGETFIGFISAVDAKVLAPKLDAGRTYHAIVTKLDERFQAKHTLEVHES